MEIREESHTRKIIFVIMITVLWIIYIYKLASYFSELYIPHSIDDVKKLSLEYSKTERYRLLQLYSLTYVFKQTFGLPGAALFNLMGGILYGYSAVPLICLLVAVGSIFTFLLSKHIIGKLIFNYCVPKTTLISLKATVDANRNHLLYYLIAVRAFPFTPALITNLAYPLIGVDIVSFSIGTFVGITPFAFICVDAAHTVSTLNSVSDILSFWVILKLVLISSVIIVPLVFKNRIIKYIKGNDEETVPLGDQQV
ncbi:Transmembrane protein 41A [Boothiomyces sp. JEL0866]|nr:Transmembrane protein 41A [Boothiomyces sp. JEL0866]